MAGGSVPPASPVCTTHLPGCRCGRGAGWGSTARERHGGSGCRACTQALGSSIPLLHTARCTTAQPAPHLQLRGVLLLHAVNQVLHPLLPQRAPPLAALGALGLQAAGRGAKGSGRRSVQTQAATCSQPHSLQHRQRLVPSRTDCSTGTHLLPAAQTAALRRRPSARRPPPLHCTAPATPRPPHPDHTPPPGPGRPAWAAAQAREGGGWVGGQGIGQPGTAARQGGRAAARHRRAAAATARLAHCTQPTEPTAHSTAQPAARTCT